MGVFNNCDDCMLEVIEKAKNELVSSTNIEDSPDEMAVIDTFLFRCWQMGWLGAKDKVRELRAENMRLRKENDDLRRLANINAMMMFLSRNCSFKDCEKCDANPLCDEAVYLQGLYGVDKDLACDADMRWKLLEGVFSDDALIERGELGTEVDDDQME